MIRVAYFPNAVSSYSGKTTCDVCGKKINLDLPFSRGVEISKYVSKPWGGSTRHAYDTVIEILYAHQGNCETMAVLQLS